MHKKFFGVRAHTMVECAVFRNSVITNSGTLRRLEVPKVLIPKVLVGDPRKRAVERAHVQRMNAATYSCGRSGHWRGGWEIGVGGVRRYGDRGNATSGGRGGGRSQQKPAARCALPLLLLLRLTP